MHDRVRYPRVPLIGKHTCKDDLAGVSCLLGVYFPIVFAAQIDFMKRNQMGVVLYLMPEEDAEEYGDTDIGNTGTIPVDFRTSKGRIVLTSRDDDAHNQRQERAKRIEACLVRKLGEVTALGDVGFTEPVMTDSNTNPCDKASHTGDIDEPVISLAFANERSQDAARPKITVANKA